MAPTRDYYADLELPTTADIQDVKKQFRKLALKYHPDRNPGREQEVNSKFQVIQSAHEILSDPTQKQKYDATLSRSRGPGASGVKGNPWANVGQHFPPPPRRNTAARNATSGTSGAQRWQTRFSHGVPPTAKQPAGSDPEAKKNAARAFENMRKTHSQGTAKNPPQDGRPSQTPPAPPPRTESQKQRAQASFGARKTGYQPRSGVSGDEPPVSASNYYSKMNAEQSNPPRPPPRPAQSGTMPDPLSQFRDRDHFSDSRQRSPYSSHGGEKTDPFDGVPLSRAKSTKESYRRDDSSSSDNGSFDKHKHRSSSVPKARRQDDAAYGVNAAREKDGRSRSANENTDGVSDTSFKHRDEPADRSSSGQSQWQDKRNAQNKSDTGPSMYGTPCDQPSLPSVFASYRNHDDGCLSSWQTLHEYHAGRVYRSREDSSPELAPSGNQDALRSLAPFELRQHLILDRLISNKGAGVPPDLTTKNAHVMTDFCHGDKLADMDLHDSFSYSTDDDAFQKASYSPEPKGFSRSSIDDINTKFGHDKGPSTWQFSASNGEQDGYTPGRSPSGSRGSRCSPLRSAATPRSDASNLEPQREGTATGFNADGWSDKFGPQTFVPQPTAGVSTSPMRPNRTNSRRVKRATTGNAAMVDDESSDGETYEWRGRNSQVPPRGTDSPQAMDIDSPPSDTPESPVEANGVRNIPVEPSRPEWRSGNVNAFTGDAKPPERPAKIPMDANAVGSEDCEEFRATLADLKNVAPFAHQPSGLRSMDDLKENLPFDSKASDQLPMELPKVQPLLFPASPEAPRLPSAIGMSGVKPSVEVWSKYLDEFKIYLQKWDEFNGQVVDHFATRKAHVARTRGSKGYGFLGARSDGDVQEYYNWVQQDGDVRRRWNAACEEHERHLREFMAFREKMK